MQVIIHPNEKNNAPSEWRVWETKIEVGSVVTPFIARSYGEELALCQRYYEKVDYTQRDTNTGVYTTHGHGVWRGPAIIFKVTKRSLPSISNNDTWRRSNYPSATVIDIGPCDFTQIKVDGFGVRVSESGVAHQVTAMLFGSASSFFYADAEI